MATHANGQHFYSPEEDEWIRQHIDSGTYPEITTEFNRLFGMNIKSISDHAIKVLHLHKSINRGDCKKGMRRCTNTLPIGSESFDGFNVYVKISDDVNDCQNRRMPSKRYDPNWIRKDYLVWQSHGHPIPTNPNEMLIHLNGDKKDCSIENLYLTTRTINLLMAKNQNEGNLCGMTNTSEKEMSFNSTRMMQNDMSTSKLCWRRVFNIEK